MEDLRMSSVILWTLMTVMLVMCTMSCKASEPVTMERLFGEMADFEELARRPDPFYKTAAATSYDRESHKGGDAWFANGDVGQYVRTETSEGRVEHVLADLQGPGAIVRFWSANPSFTNIVRFYFDGETTPRLALPLKELFEAQTPPFTEPFSYISGSGGNLYYPLPYAKSLKITVEGEEGKNLGLYYEIAYRTYESGATAVTFDVKNADSWKDAQQKAVKAITCPQPFEAPKGIKQITQKVTIEPGKTYHLSEISGPKAVYTWSARVLDTRESQIWDDPHRPHNAYRFLLLDISFDSQHSIATPLGDFFGSGPGINPYENLYFTVTTDGTMTSRLLMPFKKSMNLSLTNAGKIPYTMELNLTVGDYKVTDNTYRLRAQWGTLSKHSWPPFDMNFLDTTGEGKVIGTVYQIANPVLIWWGEGDQKIFIDNESFPSTFGTGTEDDYGYAYGNNRPFTRPYHAQTRVDGPASGGHISLNRWYVLDALTYKKAIRFDQEVWHWMPCTPRWSHVIYWYAQSGDPGPEVIDQKTLAPMDLGIRENMLDPIEGDKLTHEATGGVAEVQVLANCLGARHLFWHDGTPGDRLTVRFNVPQAGRYSVILNLCMAPDYGRYKLFINGTAVEKIIDVYAPKLFWQQPMIGIFDLNDGENVLTVEILEPNPQAKPKNMFGLDYIFLIRQ